ncbi:MAG TPA: DUF5683 domain-containing protein [Bacteroidota bacterium]|nr:DUF5683 domain-containing protein [Bacteroidota bacterium]
MKYLWRILFFFLFLIKPNFLFSQNNVDTTANVQIRIIDSVKTTPLTTNQNIAEISKMTKSPFGAVARSLILPGWGQLYVESYWKIPVFIGGMGFLTYLIIDNNNKYNNASKEVNNYQKQSDYDFYYDYLVKKREYYRDNRDQSIFIMVGVYILAAVDAYVGANLYDFNVSEDLSINISPKDLNGIAVNLQVKF